LQFEFYVSVFVIYCFPLCVVNFNFFSSFKPSTHIDENRELTIGVSERQSGG